MQVEAVFENILERIKQELWKAQKAIYIAVAWFTNKELFDVLNIKAQNRCDIFLIINDDEINNNSSIDYNNFKSKYLKIYKIRFSNKELMHNKFCVIDHCTVITGSYNWSHKAQLNFENIVISYNDNILANQFIDEFNKILRIISPHEITQGLFPLHIVVRRLEIIKNYILLEDYDALLIETEKLRQFSFNTEVSEIVELINIKDSLSVIPFIDTFIKQNRQLEVWVDKEVLVLKIELRKLENQVNAFDNEKTELEKVILEFERRHTLELGDIILKILNLRKQKYRASKDKYQEAEQDERIYQEQFDLENSRIIRNLTEQEQVKLKTLFRKATILCHPDKVIGELKDAAQKIFIELIMAYDQNDLEKVSNILMELEKGNLFKTTSEAVTEKDLLQIEIGRLKRQIKIVENKIIAIKMSATYRQVIEITDRDKYFDETKAKLRRELEQLEHEIIEMGSAHKKEENG